MKKKKHNVSQASLIEAYFKAHPNKDISHPKVVDSVSKTYLSKTGKKFRDPDRSIRKLHQIGLLQKVNKGVYRYDPKLVKFRELEDFTPEVKKQIFARDGYKCVICGKGKKEGLDIHADHIKPKDKSGRAILENGQTLCSPHNFQKKNYGQTEMGKKMFIRLYELAKKEEDKKTLTFASTVLDLFEKHGLDGHVVWKK